MRRSPTTATTALGSGLVGLGAGGSVAPALFVAGFSLRNNALQRVSAPTWKGIAQVAEDRDASLIVLGSHGRSGLSSVLVGTVAGALAAHSQRSPLIVHRHT